jgi:hypothetical protein
MLGYIHTSGLFHLPLFFAVSKEICFLRFFPNHGFTILFFLYNQSIDNLRIERFYSLISGTIIYAVTS